MASTAVALRERAEAAPRLRAERAFQRAIRVSGEVQRRAAALADGVDALLAESAEDLVFTRDKPARWKVARRQGGLWGR